MTVWKLELTEADVTALDGVFKSWKLLWETDDPVILKHMQHLIDAGLVLKEGDAVHLTIKGVTVHSFITMNKLKSLRMVGDIDESTLS